MTDRVMHDETLGALTWNAQMDWWEGEAEVAPGHAVGISLTVEDDTGAEPTAEFGHARRVLLWLRDHEPEARIVAADELLEIYNEEWNDGPEVSEDEFTARLTLADVSVSFDGSTELFYQDGGLFAGHAVLVSVDADGNFEDADVAG